MSPKWTSNDQLLFISDKSNWWNLYRYEDDGTETNLCAKEQELGSPSWEFGRSPYASDPKPESQDILVTYGEVQYTV